MADRDNRLFSLMDLPIYHDYMGKKKKKKKKKTFHHSVLLSIIKVQNKDSFLSLILSSERKKIFEFYI